MADSYLIDTSILISLYNHGRHQEKIEIISQKYSVYFCSVTANELLRGAHDARSMMIVDDFLTIANTRLVTPSQEIWVECGRISEKLLKNKKRNRQDIVLLQNDILIGLCARSIGAVLVTEDKRDFEVLKHPIKLAVEYWL